MAKATTNNEAPPADSAAIIDPAVSGGVAIASKPGVVTHITMPQPGYAGGHELIVKTN